MRLLLLPLLGSTLLLSGCWYGDETDLIRVKNRTDRAIEVRWIEDPWNGEERTSIAAGAEKDLLVRDECYEASVDARYDDRWRRYETDVDLLGYGTIWVRQEHFDPAPALPVGNG